MNVSARERALLLLAGMAAVCFAVSWAVARPETGQARSPRRVQADRPAAPHREHPAAVMRSDEDYAVIARRNLFWNETDSAPASQQRRRRSSPEPAGGIRTPAPVLPAAAAGAVLAAPRDLPQRSPALTSPVPEAPHHLTTSPPHQLPDPPQRPVFTLKAVLDVDGAAAALVEERRPGRPPETHLIKVGDPLGDGRVIEIKRTSLVWEVGEGTEELQLPQ